MHRIRPELPLSAAGHVQGERRNEPTTIGVPFPKLWCETAADLTLVAEDGRSLPLQVRVLDRWSDGSPRWALLDFAAMASSGRCSYRVEPGKTALEQPPTLGVRVADGGASIETGAIRFELRSNGVLAAGPSGSDAPTVSEFQILDARGGRMPVRVESVIHDDPGFLRASIQVRAVVGPPNRPLHLFARYHFHAGSSAVRIQVTLRNPSRAQHAGGFWDLGDDGSHYVKDFAFALSLPPAATPWQGFCSEEPTQPLRPCTLPFELYQDSSGGENWQSSNHVNREKVVPTKFRGYRIREGARETHGLRATPIVAMERGTDRVAIAQRQFWERFPKAVEATPGSLTLRFLPGQYSDLHELQGGEQISEEFVVSFAKDQVSEVPLDWVRRPLRMCSEASWYCGAEAMPYLTPSAGDPNVVYLSLVDAAIEGAHDFDRKRERIDEYGWRNFGDLYGDHETVYHQGTEPLISHYNNQYDAAAGFAAQFFRSGDLRWLTQLEDLARHVVDIDIYHTTEDKAAYNHGLFWHTAHHTDAGLATHRTYSRIATSASGGPSSEHNYNTGLMLYYFLTGDARARDAAIGLGDWVIAMDDGAQTPLRWLSRRPTGLASATGSYTYHGPGRGPGNSIVSLLNAFRLTNERKYLHKAEEIIRRCVHPADDIPALNLLDAERRWFYTVFLQAAGRYLDFKVERGEIDETYAYARTALLEYARWMVDHEYPYLEQPEILEHPTETWAAQDMRKCEVFQYAAKHASAGDGGRFLERARFFFEYSVLTLSNMETRVFTRPLVLMLTNGYSHACFQRNAPKAAPVAATTSFDFGRPQVFRPQKAVALRRLVAAAAVAAFATAFMLSRLL